MTTGRTALPGPLIALAIAAGPAMPFASAGAAPPDRAWVAQLPGVAQVMKAIRGEDADDTAHRQRTAFRVLIGYVEAMTGAGAAPPELMALTAQRRIIEYQDAWSAVEGGTRANLRQSFRDAELYAFQKATLDAVVPKVFVDAYFDTPAGRKARVEAQPRSAAASARAARDVVSARAAPRMATRAIRGPGRPGRGGRRGGGPAASETFGLLRRSAGR